MTEDEWLACTDPEVMLTFLGGKVSERKLRLFACACCRRIWHFLTHEYGKIAVQAAEQFADGLLSKDALTQASYLAYEVFDTGDPPKPSAYLAAESCGTPGLVSVTENARDAAQEAADAAEDRYSEKVAQSNVLRDIFGNPFRPVVLDRAWITSAIVSVAQAIYNDRAFDRLPILADALEEAGCTNQEILQHCRNEGPHVRGCWVVDLVLTKE